MSYFKVFYFWGQDAGSHGKDGTCVFLISYWVHLHQLARGLGTDHGLQSVASATCKGSPRSLEKPGSKAMESTYPRKAKKNIEKLDMSYIFCRLFMCIATKCQWFKWSFWFFLMIIPSRIWEYSPFKATKRGTSTWSHLKSEGAARTIALPRLAANPSSLMQSKL